MWFAFMWNYSVAFFTCMYMYITTGLENTVWENYLIVYTFHITHIYFFFKYFITEYFLFLQMTKFEYFIVININFFFLFISSCEFVLINVFLFQRHSSQQWLKLTRRPNPQSSRPMPGRGTYSLTWCSRHTLYLGCTKGHSRSYFMWWKYSRVFNRSLAFRSYDGHYLGERKNERAKRPH